MKLIIVSIAVFESLVEPLTIFIKLLFLTIGRYFSKTLCDLLIDSRNPCDNSYMFLGNL